MNIPNCIKLSECEKKIVNSIERLIGKWDNDDFLAIIKIYKDFDKLLKKHLLILAKDVKSQEAYIIIRDLWLCSTNNMKEFFEERNLYVVDMYKKILDDLLELSFFEPKQLLSVPCPENVAPIISVVIPMYKSWPFCLEALRSIYEQTFQDFEVIIVNEKGNSDPIEEVIVLFGDKRTKIVYKSKPGKLGADLNEGIRQAKGEFIARMDADDICLPERFEIQLDFLNQNQDIDICGSFVRGFQNSHVLICAPTEHESMKAFLFFKSPYSHPTVFWRRQVFLDKELWYDENCAADDINLWSRAVWKIRMANIPKVLVYYRIYENNRTFQYQNIVTEERKILILSMYKKLLKELSNEEKLLVNNKNINENIVNIFTHRGVPKFLFDQIFDEDYHNKIYEINKFRKNREFLIWGYNEYSFEFESYLKAYNLEYRIIDPILEKNKLFLRIPNTLSIDTVKNLGKDYCIIVFHEDSFKQYISTLDTFNELLVNEDYMIFTRLRGLQNSYSDSLNSQQIL